MPQRLKFNLFDLLIATALFISAVVPWFLPGEMPKITYSLGWFLATVFFSLMVLNHAIIGAYKLMITMLQAENKGLVRMIQDKEA